MTVLGLALMKTWTEKVRGQKKYMDRRSTWREEVRGEKRDRGRGMV